LYLGREHLVLYFAPANGEPIEIRGARLLFKNHGDQAPIGGSADSIDGVISTRKANGRNWLPITGNRPPVGEWELARWRPTIRSGAFSVTRRSGPSCSSSPILAARQNGLNDFPPAESSRGGHFRFTARHRRRRLGSTGWQLRGNPRELWRLGTATRSPPVLGWRAAKRTPEGKCEVTVARERKLQREHRQIGRVRQLDQRTRETKLREISVKGDTLEATKHIREIRR
jgi:hypothetical protein